MTARLLATTAALDTLVDAWRRAPRLAVDFEYNGMYVYRPVICTAQIAAFDEVAVVDTLTADVLRLRDLLGESGPVKVIHDVGFDARMLAGVEIELGNVFDTALAARFLGRTATGLGSLLQSELGVQVDKSMQHHDWAKRPLDARALSYLSSDVAHLGALADKLEQEILQKDVARELYEETRYRIQSAIVSANTPDPRPPYVRVKGAERLGATEQAILRHLADVREKYATTRNVPPHMILNAEALLAITQAKPTTRAAMLAIRGVGKGRSQSIVGELLAAVRQGMEDGAIPETDRVWFERPRLPAAQARARRAREQRLSAWRREEAKRREVDEQIVLPGHCAKEIVERDVETLDQLAEVAGIGDFRVERYGAQIIAALGAEPGVP